jgi:hypothetical protein
VRSGAPCLIEKIDQWRRTDRMDFYFSGKFETSRLGGAAVAACAVLRHRAAMSLARRARFVLRSALAVAAASVAAAMPAQGQQGRVREPLAAAVEVRGYPVGAGPLETFSARREAALSRAVAEVIAARGNPLLREDQSLGGTVQLVYRDTLVVVTGTYSNGIVCRVDIAAKALRESTDAEAAVALAASACRAAEERGWGAAWRPGLRALGSEPLPGAPGVTARLYATDRVDGLFPGLVRDIELERGTRSLLLRRQGRDEPLPREGAVQWRYAWLADGALLVLRFTPRLEDRTGRPTIGFACVATGAAAALPRLDAGAFAQWCDRQGARLRPGLPAFVAAVTAARNRQWQEESRAHPDGAPAMYGGFHVGDIPADLVDAFWRTGTVPAPR